MDHMHGQEHESCGRNDPVGPSVPLHVHYSTSFKGFEAQRGQPIW